MADHTPAPARQPPPAEPTLADVQAQHPAWQCAQGISGLFHAHQPTTGQHVTGEDPLDLSDQIKAAEARHAYGPFIP
jgi:hypothetical protein